MIGIKGDLLLTMLGSQNTIKTNNKKVRKILVVMVRVTILLDVPFILEIITRGRRAILVRSNVLVIFVIWMQNNLIRTNSFHLWMGKRNKACTKRWQSYRWKWKKSFSQNLQQRNKLLAQLESMVEICRPIQAAICLHLKQDCLKVWASKKMQRFLVTESK